jgi:hypothetical protein
MFVLNLETGKKARALIDRAGAYDLVTVRNDTKRFSSGFNWSLSKSTEIYKLRLENEKTILGLMSIREENDVSISAIKIELLEVSSENIGSKKKFDRIAGCLIAWACKISFDRGYEGNMFLVPKSNLITHFSSKYGFTHMDISSITRPFGFMIVHGKMSEILITEFLNS